MEQNGFHHYETSNYAKTGKESKHNQAYWLGNDYIGIGPSAVGTLEGNRYKNVPDTKKYIQMIQSVGHAQFDIESIDEEAFRIERIALLLRTTNGLPVHFLHKADPSEVQFLLDDGYAKKENDSLKLIGKGKLLIDSVCERLI